MSTGQKTTLKKMYNNATAQKILDYWAGRKQHRDTCLVSRTAKKTNIDEEDVKGFFRDLESAGFGRYIKSSRGGLARFEWGTVAGEYAFDYSLISVGRVAQGHPEELDEHFNNPEGIYEEEFEDVEENHTNLKAGKVMTIRTKFKGVSIRVDLPANFDPENDLGEFSELIAVLVKHHVEN